jgi:hypothetical protein
MPSCVRGTTHEEGGQAMKVKSNIKAGADFTGAVFGGITSSPVILTVQ